MLPWLIDLNLHSADSLISFLFWMHYFCFSLLRLSLCTFLCISFCISLSISMSPLLSHFFNHCLSLIFSLFLSFFLSFYLSFCFSVLIGVWLLEWVWERLRVIWTNAPWRYVEPRIRMHEVVNSRWNFILYPISSNLI